MVATTTQQKLDYLISQKVAEYDEIIWGSSVRNVVIIEGKKYQSKKGVIINSRLEKILICYI